MKFSKNTKIALAIIAGLVLAWAAFFGFYNSAYANKVLAGVTAAGVDIAGQSEDEAKQTLTKQIEAFGNQRLSLKSEKGDFTATPEDLGISILVDDTVKQAYEIGRDASWYENFWKKSKTVFEDHQIDTVYEIDKKQFNSFMTDKFRALEIPAHNASLKIESGAVLEIDGKTGIMANRKSVLGDLDKIASKMKVKNIDTPFTTAHPVIDLDDIAAAKLATINLLKNGLSLNYKDEIWKFSAVETEAAIKFIPHSKSGREISEDEALSYGEADDNPDIILGIDLDSGKYTEFLNSVAEKVNREPMNAYFEIIGEKELDISLSGIKDKKNIKDGKMAPDSKPGLEFNLEKTAWEVFEEINEGKTEIPVAAKIIDPEITEDNYEDLGITQLIGRGISNFSGSSKNRIHNISLGASHFDGVVIEPGETLDFNETIGPVELTTGYVTELVIKDHDTTPVAGGGLCQVSTTIFRGTVDAGLPITERKNHSYAVQYYAPQGTDAANYQGSTNYKFTNDTPNHILIQTKIESKNLIFDFLGTYDDRVIEKDKPTVYERFGAGGMKATWGYKGMFDGVVSTEMIFDSTYRPPEEFNKKLRGKKEEEEKKKAEEEEKKKKDEEDKKKKDEEAKKKAGAPPTPTTTPKPNATEKKD